MFFCLIKFSPFPFCHPPLTDGWYRLEPLSKDTEKDHINTLDKCELLLVYICNIADLHDVSHSQIFKMFLSMKRKFSSALINTAILLLLILCCYLGKQVSDLFQQYQKAARLQSYLSDLDSLMRHTDKIKLGAQGVNEDFKVVQSAIKHSLSIDLKHDK